jgi:hypothetical protein
MKPREEHMAEFLLSNKGKEGEAYRIRCLNFWREHYGESVVNKVEKLISSKKK